MNAQAPPRPTLDLLLFTLGGLPFALEAAQVRRVERPRSLTRVPGAPPWLCGVINLRGTIAPVINLKGYLGLEPSGPGGGGRLVVAEVRGEPVALAVDAVEGLVAVTAADLRPSEAVGSPAPQARAPLSIKGRQVTILDLNQMLG